MHTRLVRLLGAFAVLFSLIIPLVAGVIARTAYPPMVDHLVRRGGPTGPIATLYFQNFNLALAVPLVIGVVAAIAGFFVWRSHHADASEVLAKLLVIQTVAALGAMFWLGAFVLGYALG